MTGKRRLFVAMPYGARKAPLDYEKPEQVVEIDFDAVWEGILQPAIPADFETKRADELRQPGPIDLLYNEWLFDADIVLADLTFGNPNVYYELGIRQTLSKKGTVLVACKGTNLPFDVRNQYVINYDYFAAPTLRAFQTELGEAINNVLSNRLDSPVHVFLPGLFVARFKDGASPETAIRVLTERVAQLETEARRRDANANEERLLRKIKEANSPSRVLGLLGSMFDSGTASVDILEQMAIALRKHGYLDEALHVLNKALERRPDDPEIMREIGFVYRKKGPHFYLEAESFMKQALSRNDMDAELHGMLGGLLKRREDYAGARIEYLRAYALEPRNLYALVNLGAIGAAMGDTTEARLWYKRVQNQCEDMIQRNESDYWTFLCLGEASVAFGDSPSAESAYIRALDLCVPVEDWRSAVEQLECFVRWSFSDETARHMIQVLHDQRQLGKAGATSLTNTAAEHARSADAASPRR